MRVFNETEEKILDTALRLVANKGSFNITVRELSREAEVNIGAINYYFDTKDNMIELLKEFYIENTLDAYRNIFDDNLLKHIN